MTKTDIADADDTDAQRLVVLFHIRYSLAFLPLYSGDSTAGIAFCQHCIAKSSTDALPWGVKTMLIFGCNCRNRCALLAVVASIIIGVVAAFLQITGMITVTPVFLIVAFGVAVAALGVLMIATALVRRNAGGCLCATLQTVLTGILGTILVSAVLLAVGIVATSVISAILVGLTAGFFALTVAGAACFVRCLADCGE
jgi:hypothetical protein